MKTQISAKLEVLGAKMDDLKESVNVAKDLANQQQKEQKRVKQNLRYKMLKHARRYQVSGAHATIAKLASEMQYYYDHATEQRPRYFLGLTSARADGSIPITMADPWIVGMQSFPLKDMLEALDAAFKAKDDHIHGKLCRPENKSLRGLYAQLDCDEFDASTLEMQAELKPDVSVCKMKPFALGFRKATCRHGAHAWPLPGMGSWVWAPHQPVMVLIVKIQELVSSGMLHLDQLPDSMDNKEKKIVAHLERDQVLWVPWGFVAMPVGFEEINMMRVLPWPSSKLRDELPADVADIIWQACSGFARKNAEKVPWKELLKHIDALLRKPQTEG